MRFNELTSDSTASNILCAEAMSITTSIIRIGQSKFVTVPINQDLHEHILNCIQTLSELEATPAVREIFFKDTNAACTKMLDA